MGPNSDRGVRQTETACIVGFTAIGAILRFWGFGRLGLDHFDEGIYAMAATWSSQAGGIAAIDPGLIPYAPPGFPILVGLVYAMGGISDSAAILISVFTGVATIPVIGHLGRVCFGPGVGAAAAGFAALSFEHVAFSRMALVDSTFLLLVLLTTLAGLRFLERPGIRRAIALGLGVGLSQEVKYNGWLGGGVILLAALVGLVVDSGERQRSRVVRVFGPGLVAVIVAALVVWPWFRFVDSQPGGYSALLRHQRGYLGQTSDWPHHLWLQLGQATSLSSRVAEALAVVLAVAACRRFRFGAPEPGRTFFRAAGLLAIALGAVPATSGWWLGLVLAPWLVTVREPKCRVVGVWWIVLTVLTPFYHPYARLWLPVEAVGWIFRAVAIRVAIGAPIARLVELRKRSWLVLALVISGAVAWAQSTQIRPTPVILDGPLGPTDSFEAAVNRVVADLPPEVRAVTLWVRPPFLFYGSELLGRRGVVGRRVGSFDELMTRGQDWAIVDSALIRQEGDGEEARVRLSRRWKIAAEESSRLSNVTLLDVDPASTFDRSRTRDAPLLLLRPRGEDGRR